jgi:hypothetical protein
MHSAAIWSLAAGVIYIAATWQDTYMRPFLACRSGTTRADKEKPSFFGAGVFSLAQERLLAECRRLSGIALD